jgi:hypothetical protein
MLVVFDITLHSRFVRYARCMACIFSFENSCNAVYEYHRNTITSANDYFVKQSQKASGESNRPPKLIRNITTTLDKVCATRA